MRWTRSIHRGCDTSSAVRRSDLQTAIHEPRRADLGRRHYLMACAVDHRQASGIDVGHPPQSAVPDQRGQRKAHPDGDENHAGGEHEPRQPESSPENDLDRADRGRQRRNSQVTDGRLDRQPEAVSRAVCRYGARSWVSRASRFLNLVSKAGATLSKRMHCRPDQSSAPASVARAAMRRPSDSCASRRGQAPSRSL